MIKIIAVAHEKNRLNFLYKTLIFLEKNIKSKTEIILMISSSGNCKMEDILETNKKNKVNFIFNLFEDKYFDFSGYASGFMKIDSSCDGCIFINDTVSNKHRSLHLIRLFSEKINQSLEFFVGGPILVGPYGKSEFSFSYGLVDEYVPTYLFYLNNKSFDKLRILYSKFNTIENCIGDNFENKSEFSEYKGFVGLHASQIFNRFTDHQKMNKKLVTAIVERCISVDVKKEGIIWFCDLGIKNKIRIFFQKKFGKLFN